MSFSPVLADDLPRRSETKAGTYVRNICAHYARLWNGRFVIKVAKKHPKDKSDDAYFYTAYLIIRDLVEKVAPNTAWGLKFAVLLKQHPKVLLQRWVFRLIGI